MKSIAVFWSRINLSIHRNTPKKGVLLHNSAMPAGLIGPWRRSLTVRAGKSTAKAHGRTNDEYDKLPSWLSKPAPSLSMI